MKRGAERISRVAERFGVERGSGMRFRCDDASGFELIAQQSPDGDFWLSVRPRPDDFKREHDGNDELFLGCYSASVRIRTPMAGGGSHAALWYALVDVFKSARTDPTQEK